MFERQLCRRKLPAAGLGTLLRPSPRPSCGSRGFQIRSPRTGPQPRDVLRLARPPGEGLARGAKFPSEFPSDRARFSIMDPVLARPIPAEGVEARARPAAQGKLSLRARLWRLSIAAALVLILASVALIEMRTSNLQALVLSRLDHEIHFSLEPGPSSPLRAPGGGPYDMRLGYTRLPDFLQRLHAAGYAIDSQARPSARMRRLVERGLFPIYREKTQAGLRVTDREGRSLYEARFPERVYESFEAIPLPVVRTLLFIENRELLDSRRPRLNPAVEWHRLAKALGVDLFGRLGRQGQAIGASTLATQIEKFRHSPEGRTRSAGEKFRQMLSASLRAY